MKMPCKGPWMLELDGEKTGHNKVWTVQIAKYNSRLRWQMNARSLLQGFKNGCTIDQEDDYIDGMMNISKRWRHHEACKRVGKSCKIEHKN